jgi:hypothetical protein
MHGSSTTCDDLRVGSGTQGLELPLLGESARTSDPQLVRHPRHTEWQCGLQDVYPSCNTYVARHNGPLPALLRATSVRPAWPDKDGGVFFTPPGTFMYCQLLQLFFVKARAEVCVCVCVCVWLWHWKKSSSICLLTLVEDDSL